MILEVPWLHSNSFPLTFPALLAFEGHDNVDAKFVEEAALKHTTMLLGL